MSISSSLAAPPRQRASSVALSGVGRVFDHSRVVLRDVTLEITPGEIVALIGASGCGKSTLLRQILGLDTPTAGWMR